MKLLKTIAIACMTLAPISMLAQGVKIHTKNGETIKVSYEDLDYIEPYAESDYLYPNMEYVDLGLSVKWATTNVGAETPDQVGVYYQWAGVTFDPEVSVNKLTTPYQDPYYADPDYFQEYFTKYCNNQDLGIPDYKMTLEPEDDAARMNCGRYWRIPTREEMQELVDNCTWTRVEADATDSEYPGKLYYKVTGPNGNSIILPAGGYYFGKKPYYENEEFHYNTSSLDESSCAYCWSLEISSWGEKTPRVTYYYRYMGVPVRPVYTGE